MAKGETPFFEDINVGDEGPPLVIENLSRTQIVKYAGASGDFNPIHHDEKFATEGAGYPSVFGHGMLTMGFCGHFLTDWFGDGTLRKFRARFTRQVWPGDTITCKGAITNKHEKEGEQLVDCDIVAENQRGEKVVTGSATAALPTKS